MTKTVKHTPGPWSYRPSKHDDWGFVRAEPLPGETLGHLVAVAKDSSVPLEAHDDHREKGTDPFEANARLIAAAPELLEALRELDAAWDDGLCNSGTPDFDSHRLGRAQDAAKAAIAKAEGRS